MCITKIVKITICLMAGCDLRTPKSRWDNPSLTNISIKKTFQTQIKWFYLKILIQNTHFIVISRYFRCKFHREMNEVDPKMVQKVCHKDDPHFGSTFYLKISYNMFFVNINMTILEIKLTPPKNYTQNLYDSNIFMFRL